MIRDEHQGHRTVVAWEDANPERQVQMAVEQMTEAALLDVPPQGRPERQALPQLELPAALDAPLEAVPQEARPPELAERAPEEPQALALQELEQQAQPPDAAEPLRERAQMRRASPPPAVEAPWESPQEQMPRQVQVEAAQRVVVAEPGARVPPSASELWPPPP